MQLRYNVRLYPTPGQRQALARAFGCARVVFNDGLRARQDTREQGLPYICDGDLSKQVITEAKTTPQRAWLGDVSSVVLQQALADLNTAYRNFFTSVTGRRKGSKVGPPRFRSKRDNRQAIRFTKNARFSITAGGKLRLPKIGDVDVRWSRDLPAEPSSVTVIKDSAGRYFASFVVEVAEQPLPPVEPEAGIDLGLSAFAVLSDGRKIDAPRFLRRAEKKLKKLQRALSRKEKGSNNRAKARQGVARQHAKVADARREFHHQLSTRLIRDNQAIYVEDLAVAGLARTRLAKSVHDAGWSAFVGMLEYKARLYGRAFHRINRWFPSSKLCSECGTVAGTMPLDVRSWTCPCGAVHDRDVNAAKNILAAGRADRLNACGGQVRPPHQVAQPEEAGSLRGAA
ncbi:transposase [Microtetraspora sp. NBRC 16547]|uniref:RNA-guided endonuclease InsQ/TnpB family protein n=1 Tax=Microtetraspora sp. NBRC 16547 TaxID=3030993 RepID=UPI0024A360CC|nr:transposase [Microtetraspora sp. NBRC 16547]GLW96795.1 transposase [Microtetraspora sp. NBRC 16547]